MGLSLTVRQRDVLAVLAAQSRPVAAKTLPGKVGAGLAGVRRCLAALTRRGLVRACHTTPVTYEITPLGRAALAVDGGRPTTTAVTDAEAEGDVDGAGEGEPEAVAVAVVLPLPAEAPELDGGGELAPVVRELAVLARRLDEVEGSAGQLDELAALVTELAETVAAKITPAGEPAASWLEFPARPEVQEDAQDLLERLAAWVGSVYLRYRDAITGFPDCWLWHPEIVEELLWLNRAWQAAYAPGAPASLLGDWHDRQRPGVMRRIKDYAGVCSLEAHLPGADRHNRAAEVPVADAIAAVAAWWVTGRAEPGPVPTDDQLRRANIAARYTSRNRR
jgi:hypothetical protein